MAGGRIKGITIELDGDTSGLTQALKKVDSETKSVQGELRQVENLLKFNPDSVELLAQKQKLLGDAVQSTSKRLDVLKQAQLEVERQFKSGEIGEEAYRKFQREIIATEGKLKAFQKQAENVDAKIKATVDIGGIEKAKTQIKELGTAAKEAGKEIGSGLAAGAAAGTAAIAGLTMGMAETNKDLSMLEEQVGQVGLALEDIGNARTMFDSVGQETDQVTEAMGNLIQAGYQTRDSIEDISASLAGAVVKYGDTFNVEGLAESITTTTQLGEVTGQLTDLLEKEGVNVEDFNAKMQSLSTEQERANYISQLLADQGLTSMYNKYAENNSAIVDASAAQITMTDELSRLSELLTPLVTMVVDFTSKLVGWANENQGLATTVAVVMGAITALSGIFMVLSPIVSGLVALWPVLTAAIGAITGPIGLAVAAIGLIVTALVTAYAQSETFRDGVNSVFGAIKDFVVDVFTNISDFVNEKITLIKDFWDENGPLIEKAFATVFSEIQKVVEDVFPAIQTVVETVIGVIGNVIDLGLNTVLSVVKIFASAINGDWSGLWDGVKQLLQGALDFILGLIESVLGKDAADSVSRFVADVVRFFTNLYRDAVKIFAQLEQGAKIAFSSIETYIVDPIQRASDRVGKIIEGIKGFFSGLKLEIPSIKLPKLPSPKISGKFSLDPPSVPKISWNAMGGVFNKPTILQSRAGLQGVGEAGSEAIIPLKPDVLAGIGKGIAEQMNVGMPSTIVVHSVLDGRVVAETITPFVSQNQQSHANLTAAMKGVSFG